MTSSKLANYNIVAFTSYILYTEIDDEMNDASESELEDRRSYHSGIMMLAEDELKMAYLNVEIACTHNRKIRSRGVNSEKPRTIIDTKRKFKIKARKCGHRINGGSYNKCTNCLL